MKESEKKWKKVKQIEIKKVIKRMKVKERILKEENERKKKRNWKERK